MKVEIEIEYNEDEFKIGSIGVTSTTMKSILAETIVSKLTESEKIKSVKVIRIS